MSILIKADSIWFKPDCKDRVKLPPELWITDYPGKLSYARLLIPKNNKSMRRFLYHNGSGLIVLRREQSWCCFRVLIRSYDWSWLGYKDSMLKAYLLDPIPPEALT